MRIFYLCFLFISSFHAHGQEIRFSSLIKKDNTVGRFYYNIVGKVGENYCVYKRLALGENVLALYDANMRLISNKRLTCMPFNSNVVSIINYTDFLQIFFTYRTEKALYLKAIRLDPNGRELHQPVTLDEVKVKATITQENVPQAADLIKYYVTSSEDQKYILCSKRIKNNDSLKVSTKLWSAQLELIQEEAFELPSNIALEVSTLPRVDNSGTIFFTKASVSSNLWISKLDLISKALSDESLRITNIPLAGFHIAELRIDIDNLNKRCLVNALFLNANTKDVDGLFTASIDADNKESIQFRFNHFSDALRATINRDSTLADAFNFLTIHNVAIKKDGHFVVYVEEKSSMPVGPRNEHVPRPDHPSKWDTNPTVQAPTHINPDVNPHLPAFNPPGSLLTPQPRIYDAKVANFSNSIVIVEVDSLLNLTWNSVITKIQIGEEKYMSFGTYVDGAQTHFLFTGFQTTALINNYSILDNGDFIKNDPIKILESDRKLMPRGLHQVGLQKVIIPATYRRRIVFALVDFAKPFKLIY